MPEEILKLSKWFFLVIFIWGIIAAILWWMPTIAMPLMGFLFDPVPGAMCQMFAAAITGLSVASLLCFWATEWKAVKIVVIAELIWIVAGLIGVTINVPVVGLGAISVYITLVIMLVMFVIIYLRQEGKMK